MTIRMLTTEELIAELAEQRALTERNSGEKPVTVTQSTGQTDSGLARIHEAAKVVTDIPVLSRHSHIRVHRTIPNFVLTISITI
jgi:hypothetical protein